MLRKSDIGPNTPSHCHVPFGGVSAADPAIKRAIDAAEARLGMEEITRRLKLPAETVRAWRDGHIVLPAHNLLALTDALMPNEDRDPDS